MLDRVEVIPNPSAKYDPEGMAGIINVVLKQNAELGLSGGVSATGGTTGQLNTSGMLGYQKGLLTLLGNYGYLHDARDMEGFTNLSVLGDGTLPTSYQDQAITGDRIRDSHTFNASGEYKLSKFNALTTNLILSKRDITSDNNIQISQLNATRSLTDMSRQVLNGSTAGHNVDYTLAYKRTSKIELNSFTTEARFFNARNTDSNLFTTQPLTTQGQPMDAKPDLLTNIPGMHRQNFTLQSDVTHALGKFAKLEAGYKGTLRKLDSDLAVSRFSYPLNRYVLDTNRSSTFTYDERVNAVYTVLSRGVAKWDLQGGLRLERASTTFELRNTSTKYNNEYYSLFPSALVAYNVDDGHQVKLSYSKRIRRPDADHMNPFTEYEDALDVSTGNPYLKPEYTHAFQLGFQMSGQHASLQATPFYRHTVDPERRIRSIDNTGLTTITFVNVASANSYGSEFIGSLKMHTFSGFAGLTAFRQVTDGSTLTTDFSNNAVGWSARANVTWNLTPKLDMQTLYNYRAPMTVEQGRISRQSMLNVAFRQKLMKERLSVSLRANDVFKQSGSGFTSTDPRLLQVTQRRTFARGLFLSVNYNFGQQPRLRDRNSDALDSSQ
jgi:outer membrane receptor protein involved in Fe transport